MEIHVGRFYSLAGLPGKTHVLSNILLWLRPALTTTLTRLTHSPTTTDQALFRLDTKVSVMLLSMVQE